ncbi:MAG: S41 family peptidase, partial [Rickettsiaceae bacterium]|nr:S41 family peptidase [Rickettsiaceae bacterium]
MKLKINFFAALILASSIAEASFTFTANDQYFEKFKQVYEILQRDYVKEPKKQELIDYAIEGMLSSLDPHSGYFADEDLEYFVSATKGEFGGIGIEIVFENNAIKVISPIDDLPSHKAGIKSGDYIVKINNELVSNLGYNKSLLELRGNPGTKVKISVIREGESKPIEYELVREIVKINAVKSNIDGNIAYIRISTFSEKAFADLKKAIKTLEEQNKDKIKGIILDVRNNPGGLLDQAIAISDYFLDNGVIVSTKGRKQNTETIHKVNPNGFKAPKLPMIVLINEGSASAAEIVAAALQDNKRALLLGTKTYGKGSVQVLYPLDQRSACKFTTSLYYTPNGISIQAEGVHPDILIEPAKVEYAKKDENGFRFSESSFKNHIKNDQKKSVSDSKNTTEKDEKLEINKNKQDKSDKSEKGDKSQSEKTEVSRSTKYVEDFQYARAYDLLQGIIILE